MQPAPVQSKPAEVVKATPTVTRTEPERNSAGEVRRLQQIVRQLREAAAERDAALDDAYTVACKEHRPRKFEERREKIVARYDGILLRLLGREDLIAKLAEKEPERREPVKTAPVAERQAPAKGSSAKEIEASRDVVELRAKLRRIEAEIADEKDDSADRLEHLLAARKRL